MSNKHLEDSGVANSSWIKKIDIPRIVYIFSSHVVDLMTFLFWTAIAIGALALACIVISGIVVAAVFLLKLLF